MSHDEIELFKKKMRRAVVAFGDLSQAQQYLHDLHIKFPKTANERHPWVKSALELAFVVSYCRAFKKSEPKSLVTGYLPLELKNQLTAEETTFHDEIITRRDEIDAHSDLENRDLKITLCPKAKGGWLVPNSAPPGSIFSDGQIERIYPLCGRWMSIVLDHINDICSKLPEGISF